MRFVISADVNLMDASNNPITFLPGKDTVKKINTFVGDVGKEILQRAEVQRRRMEAVRKKCIDLVFFVVMVSVMLFMVMMCAFSGGEQSSCKSLPMPNYQILLGKVGAKS